MPSATSVILAASLAGAPGGPAVGAATLAIDFASNPMSLLLEP